MGLRSVTVTITSLSAARKRALELKVLVSGGTDPLVNGQPQQSPAHKPKSTA